MSNDNGKNPAIQPDEKGKSRRRRGTHVSLVDPERAKRVEAYRKRVEAEARAQYPGATIDTRAAVSTLVDLGLDAAEEMATAPGERP